MFAQTSSNVQVGFLNTLGENSSLRSFGIGGGLSKAFTAKLVVGVSANIYIGGKSTLVDTVFAYSGSTTPATALVDIERGGYSYTGGINLKYYFVGDAESDLGVYGMAGFGIMKLVIKTKAIGSYDQASYGFHNSHSVGDMSLVSGIGPDFGIGFEKLLGSQYFFANARFFLPVISTADASAGFEAPKAIMLESGLRIPF